MLDLEKHEEPYLNGSGGLFTTATLLFKERVGKGVEGACSTVEELRMVKTMDRVWV